ncbi:EsaB/YukD family protein [Nocardia huaxiensis]|uniref:EsaB/YukD family protein n=1 Tax=Nocardia huaxiensis TaxID=2755382 RepID=A0A7D6ZDE6_9NOCA|nr:EsaB/YukD family protein [Nocardia huaxiensis]QLY32848.1 EsaB/YukD family protein [Nocardia huaxiensis]
MSAHFIRLSVVSGENRLDVSLPARRPIAEYLTDITELLELEPADADTVWVLSAPSHGLLEYDATLAEAGVLDGTVLHLTSRELAARTPYVEDVVDTVETSVDRSYQRFADGRERVLGGLLVAGFTGTATLVTALRAGWFGTLTLVVLAAVIAVLAFACGPRGRDTIGWGLVPVLAAAAISGMWERPLVAALAGIAAGFAGAAIATGIGSRRAGVLLGAGASALLFAALAAAVWAGANVTALSAWAAPVLVALVAVAPRAATASSGLLGLVRRGENGEPVPRPLAEAALGRGRDFLDVAVGAAALALSLAVATMIWTGIWMQAALAGMVAVGVLLRTRGYTDTRHVAPLLLVPLVAALAGSAALVRDTAQGDTAIQAMELTGAGALIGLTVAIAGYVRVGEVAAARLARLWNALDPTLLVLLFPATFAAQGIYTYLWD